MEMLLSFFAGHLIEFMTLLLVTALLMRFLSFQHSKTDEAYFSHFTRELAATINEDKAKGTEFEDSEDYLTNILARVNQRLPERNLRLSNNERQVVRGFDKNSVSLKDYVGSKHGLIASIHGESNVFNSKVPPNFGQLTDRVMNEDKNWSKLFGVLSIDGVTRMLDVLPTLFIIFGVFGTFIGISLALPEIARIDFNNLESSGQTLTDFVISVAFAMKTSVAGIFYSIILTLLNTFYPIEATREKTFDKVETVLQILWYHMQSDKAKEEEGLGQILKALKKISGQLSFLEVPAKRPRRAV